MFTNKQVSVFVIGCTLLSAVYGNNLLTNGGMEKVSIDKKTSIATGFRTGFYKGSKGNYTSDSQIVHRGKKSMQFVKANKPGWQQLVTYVKFKPLVKTRKIEVSAWVYGQDVTQAGLVFFAGTRKKQQSIWTSFAVMTGTFGWKKYTKTFTLVPGMTQAALSIRLQRGPGVIWVDDCSMRWLSASVAETGKLLKNPEMAGAFIKGLPSGWEKQMVHGYETVAEYASAKGPGGAQAIAMIWKNGGGKFGVRASTVKPLTGAFEFSVKVKTKGASRAILVVSAYNKKDTLLERQESSQVKGADWQKLKLKFILPPKTSKTELTCMNMGQGTVSVTDASLQRIAASSIKSFPMDAICMPVEIMKTAVGKAEFNTFATRPVPLAFHFKGKRGVKDAALVIEVPVQLKFAEAYNTHTGLKLKKEIPEEQKISVNGKPYVRYTFKKMAVLRIIQAGYGWERKLAMAFLPQKGNVGKRFRIYWYLSGNSKKSNTRSFELNVLPDMKKTANPKNFPFMVWNQFDTNFNQPELFRKVAANYQEAGINYRKRTGTAEIRRHDDLLEKSGWKMFATQPGFLELRFINGKELVKQFGNKLEYCVMSDGKVKKHELCPSYFSTDPAFRRYLFKFIADKFDQYGVKDGEVIILDNEPWDPGNWCLCMRCRRAFADYAKLKKIPNVSAIKKNHSKQWRDFRCKVHSEVTKTCADAVRKARPKAVVGDYDYAIHFNNPNYRDYYYSVAKDPVLNEKYIDLHQSSYYHYLDKTAMELIELNAKNLKKEYHVIAGLDRAGTYLSAKEVLSPARMRLMLLGAATGGAKGFGLYPGCHIDGKHLLAMDQAMAEIAKNEEFFAKGIPVNGIFKVEALPFFRKEINVGGTKRIIQRPDWKPHFASRAFKLKDQVLLVMLNYHPEKDAFVNISARLPKGKYTLVDLATGKRLLPKKQTQYFSAINLKDGVICKVKHTDAALYRIRPYLASDAKIPAFYSDAFHQQFEQLKAASVEKAFKSMRRDNMSITEDDVDGNGTVDICLKTPSQKVWINAEVGGLISGWKIGKVNFCNTDKGVKLTMRSMLWDNFWTPKSMRGMGSQATCRVIKSTISKDAVSLTLCKDFKKQNLQIFKTILVQRNSPVIKVKIKIVNTGTVEKTLSYWSHNLPCVGAPAIAKTNMAMLISTSKGLEVISGAKASKFVSDATGKFGVYAKNEHEGMIIEVNKAQLLQAYVWRGSGQTLEWMYKPVTIKPNGAWETSFSMTAFPKLKEKEFRSKL